MLEIQDSEGKPIAKIDDLDPKKDVVIKDGKEIPYAEYMDGQKDQEKPDDAESAQELSKETPADDKTAE